MSERCYNSILILSRNVVKLIKLNGYIKQPYMIYVISTKEVTTGAVINKASEIFSP